MYSLEGLYLTDLEPITYKQTQQALFIGDGNQYYCILITRKHTLNINTTDFCLLFNSQFSMFKAVQFYFYFFSAEIRNLEGLAASLSQTGGLDPEQHRVIASSLERNLLRRFKIPLEQESELMEKEDSILKDSEAYYVRRTWHAITQFQHQLVEI